MAVLICVVAAVPAAGAASAAKQVKGKPGKLAGRSTSVSLPPHQLGTAVATCPAGAKAVGGGFVGEPGGVEPTVVTESRRGGPRSWIVSGLRASALTTTNGQLTAVVRCRPGAPKITEVAASTTIPAATGPGDHPSGAVTATCPGRRHAISGGFASEADAKNALAVLPQQSQRTAGGKAWTVAASHNNPAARQLTAYAYCARASVKKASDAVSLTGDLTTKSADAGPCGARSPVAGGFVTSKATLANGGDIVFVLSSLPHGGGWRTTGLHSGSKSTGSLRSFVYCG